MVDVAIQVETEPIARKPWQVLNERDKGEIVTHFLHGLSPSQIATLTKRSLPFVYEVLQSEEAQETISRYEQEREHGLMQVGERLQTSTVALVDQLLMIALTGSKESNRLNAVKHGLALAGMVPIQKIASVSAKVVISQDKLNRAMETIAWESPAQAGMSGDKRNDNGTHLLDQLAGALNSTGAGGVVVTQLSPSGGTKAGLASEVPSEHVLPGEGGAWVRSPDAVSPSADLPDVAESRQEAQVDRTSSGPLQEHDGHQDLPGVAPSERPPDENPYYQRDRD
jgi:hypothetical protein